MSAEFPLPHRQEVSQSGDLYRQEQQAKKGTASCGSPEQEGGAAGDSLSKGGTNSAPVVNCRQAGSHC